MFSCNMSWPHPNEPRLSRLRSGTRHGSPTPPPPSSSSPPPPEESESESEGEGEGADSLEASLRRQHRQNASNNPTASRSASPSSPSSEENAEEDLEVDIDFYDRSKKPKVHICPFSDSSRMNPCSTHRTPRKRRDAITAHLNSFRLYGFNLEHPQDDPLWQEWVVKDYYLKRRPKKFGKKLAKKRGAEYSAKYYDKRKKRQRNELPEWKAKLAAKEITEDEYKKLVIGKERRDFLKQLDIEKQVNE